MTEPGRSPDDTESTTARAGGSTLTLRSSAFTDSAFIPARYSKDGGNERPDLEWSGVPEGSQELVLLCVDPDAPAGTWLHWLVTGIDPATTRLDPQSPAGTEHGNDYGEHGYGGPQPPVGDDAHRYLFRLYALGEPFGAPEPGDADAVRSWLDGQALATGTLTGLYQR